ncbi:MAG: hypothetical protein IJV33_02650 [Bacteroidaceae bacterium]|nr:hypothetical protein [Bacteroidaceae bacterium]
MNKKLLLATMSLAALAACTTNEFESQQKAAENVSPIQFELINGSDAETRASMGGWNNNTITWSAKDKDLFTLYHGGTLAGDPLVISGVENATYTAKAEEGKPAALTTPSMIKKGSAIMVWPVDTTFRYDDDGNKLIVSIPAKLEKKTDDNPSGGVENKIPYVSDLIDIDAYTGKDYENNTAGYNRKYPVYMRPMASQINLNAVYKGTDKIDALVNDADDPIQQITVDRVALITKDGGNTMFSTKLPVTFKDATTVNISTSSTTKVKANWDAKAEENNWTHITGLNRENPGAQTARLETTCPIDNSNLMKGCKFLILPQKDIPSETGVENAAIDVETYYGRVLIAHPDEYPATYTGKKHSVTDYNNAWYRYVSSRITTATDDENVSSTEKTTIKTADGDKIMYKTVAKSPKLGLRQTINTFNKYVVPEGYTVSGEYMGVASDRYVNVDLAYLDMSNLHIKSDKQLRDVARVWKALGLKEVTVIIDGDKDKVFEISQKTIGVINGVNKDTEGKYLDPLPFTVKPCVETGEECTNIVITGGGNVQDIAFIVDTDNNSSTKPVANVTLKAKENWTWAGTVKVAADGVGRIYNEGTMTNASTTTLKTEENDGTQNNVRLQNNGTWNINGTGTVVNVQFNVTNQGEVNIAKGAQYRQDGTGHDFLNSAVTLPARFLKDQGINPNNEVIGKVNNNGVFATVDHGTISNVGLIEHLDADAKTFITSNQQTGNFASPFKYVSPYNRMGRINLPFSNKEEDNISISAAADKGFVSVTVTAEELAKAGVTDGILNADVVGERVNYIIINSGIKTIANVSDQVKYLEINDPSKKEPNEIVWSVSTATTYTGLIVLSDVNIKLNTEISADVTYLSKNATMYVGGKFNKAATNWAGYYGDTSGNVTTNYVYFGN